MLTVRRGEVWWVDFEPSVGGEIQKTRPAVIISNNIANAALNRVVVVPLSSQTAKLFPSEVFVMIEGRQAKAMADQITTASKLRLKNRVGSLSGRDVAGVERAVLVHLGMKRE